MLPRPLLMKAERTQALPALIAVSFVLLAPVSLAQSDSRNTPYISQEVLSTALMARRSAIEIELRKIAQMLLDAPEIPTSTNSNNQTLKLAPAGTIPNTGQYFGTDGALANSHFFYLPNGNGFSLARSRDANSMPIAYCAFDLPNAVQNPPEGFLRGSSSTTKANRDAIAMVIISAGPNGQYEFTCDNFRDAVKGQAVTASQTSRSVDDIYAMYTFYDVTYSGANSRFLEKSVATYDGLLKIDKNDLYDGQIRWVTKTKQFFKASLVVGGSVTWEPLNAGFRYNDNQPNFADPTQFDMNLLSGGVGIGTQAQNPIPSTSKKPILSLGTKSQDQNGNITNFYQAAIDFQDPLGGSFAYLGMNSEGNAFVLNRSGKDSIKLDFDSNLSFSGTKISLTGAISVNGTLTTSGLTTLNTLSSSGLATLGNIGNTTQILVVNGSSSFTGPLTAKGGLTVGEVGAASLTNNLLTVYGAGNFKGIVTADGGINLPLGQSLSGAGGINLTGNINAKTATFSGPLTATNGMFTGVLSGLSISTAGSLTAGSINTGGGLKAATGEFSELVSANGGLKASTGEFAGLLSANGGLKVIGDIDLTGNITAYSATFKGPVTAQNGTFEGVLSGSSITTAGNLTAGSINTTSLKTGTGEFSGLLSANGGFNVIGSVSINGDLILKGNLISGNVTTLRFFAPSIGNSDFSEIGSAQFTSTTGLLNVNLGYANPFFYSINQNLGVANTPVFAGLRVGTLNADGSLANRGTIQGDLQGTAEQLNQTLNLKINQRVSVADPSGYITTMDAGSQTASFNLRPVGDKLAEITLTGYIDQRDQRRVDIYNSTFYGSATFQCNNAPNGIQLCPAVPQNLTVSVNGTATANFTGQQSYSNTIGGGGDISTLSERITALEQKSIRISLTGNILSNAQTATAKLGETASLSLDTASTLNYAKNMNQDVMKSSGVTFAQLTVSGGGKFGSVSTDTLTVNQNAVIQRILQMNNGSGAATIRINGDEKTINFPGGGGRVTAENFIGDLIGNADTATKLKKPIKIELSGALSGNSTSTDNVNYTLDVALVDGKVTEFKIAQNAVTESRIKDSAVTSAKISDGAVITAKISDGAVTEFKIAQNAVTESRIKDSAVTSAKISDGAVTEFKISDGAVTEAKIAQNAVTESRIKDSAVTEAKIAQNAVTESKIKNGAVTSAKISNDAVTSAKIFDGAVITAKIANGAVTTEKIAIGATITNSNNLISPSDTRLKDNIARVEGSALLAHLSETHLFSYSFRDDPAHKRTLGVIAQEIQPLFPELVTLQTEGKNAGYYAVNYGLLGALASAGVGHLNKKVDSLGLQLKSPTTLTATLPNFTVSNITAERLEAQKIKAQEIEATKGKFEDVTSDKLTMTNGKATRMQADTINSGQTEGYAGLGSALPLFGAGTEGHFIVNVSSPDGSYATASVFVSNGNIHVVPVASQNISIVPSMGMVHAVSNGKTLKATWLKTG